MGVRVGILCLAVMAASWACDARHLVVHDLSGRNVQLSDTYVTKINKQGQESKGEAVEEVARNDNVCTLCEEFAGQALDYIAANKTQTEIIDTLHMACSRVPSFKQECITLVDYYAPLFFLEISTIQPEDFCKKVNLCDQTVKLRSQLNEDSCGICHHAVSEVLIKLKDPDTQLEIIEVLLKGCNAMDNYAKKCKKLVFEYGPLILANAEQFLETNDVCAMLHACDSTATNEQASQKYIPVLADS